MRKSKLVFIIIAIVFFIIMTIIAIDISSRTSFPGQNKAPVEQMETDTTTND
jgi:hypothetical protein